MGCGFRGDFRKVTPVWPGEPVKYECPVCGSMYRPAQEVEGKAFVFAGDSVDLFARATDPELIEELWGRGYTVSLKGVEITEKNLRNL